MRQSNDWEQQAIILFERLRLRTNVYDPEQPDEQMDIQMQLNEIWRSHLSCTPFLLSFLHDNHVEVRDAAVRGLWLIHDPQATSSLINVLRDDPDLGVRSTAAGALGAIGSRDACEALLAVVKTGTDTVIMPAVLRALANFPTADVVAAIIPSLADLNIRSAAVEALGRIDLPTSTEALIGLLMQPVRLEKQELDFAYSRAASILGSRHDPRIFLLLQSLLANGSHGLLLGAIVGLGKLKDARAIVPLQRLLNIQLDRDLSNSVIISLGKLGDHTVNDRLIALISQQNIVNAYPWLFLEVVEALVALQETSAVPYLKAAIEQMDLEYYEEDEMDNYEMLVNTVRDAIDCLEKA